MIQQAPKQLRERERGAGGREVSAHLDRYPFKWVALVEEESFNASDHCRQCARLKASYAFHYSGKINSSSSHVSIHNEGLKNDTYLRHRTQFSIQKYKYIKPCDFTNISLSEEYLTYINFHRSCIRRILTLNTTRSARRS